MTKVLSDQEVRDQTVSLELFARGLNRQLETDMKQCSDLTRSFADSLPFVNISNKECVEDRQAAAACLRANPGKEASCFTYINAFSACVDRLNGALWPKASYKPSAD